MWLPPLHLAEFFSSECSPPVLSLTPQLWGGKLSGPDSDVRGQEICQIRFLVLTVTGEDIKCRQISFLALKADRDGRELEILTHQLLQKLNDNAGKPVEGMKTPYIN